MSGTRWEQYKNLFVKLKQDRLFSASAHEGWGDNHCGSGLKNKIPECSKGQTPAQIFNKVSAFVFFPGGTGGGLDFCNI